MRYLLPLFFAVFLASAVYADGGKGKEWTGGFQGPLSGAQATTVAEAKNLSDDARVILTGNIVSQIVGTKHAYIFKDDTGEIRVDIKRKVFGDRLVNPQDKVRIAGKIDKDWGEDLEVDVKHLEVLK